MSRKKPEKPAQQGLTNSSPRRRATDVIDSAPNRGLDGAIWPSQFVSTPEGPKLTVGHDLHEVPGGARRLLYYRYQVWHGHTIAASCHIPGGNISNPIAQARGDLVRKAIAAGESPDKILRQIEQWRRKKPPTAEQLQFL